MARNTRVKTVKMDFEGSLCLVESGRWIYCSGSGDTRTRISTRQTSFEKAVEVARRMSVRSHMALSDFGIAYESDYFDAFKGAKKNSQKRGIPFSLTTDELKLMIGRSKGACELTGIVFQRVRSIGPYERQPFMPSIDRIDSTGGYSMDNVRLLCTAANYAISTWGDWVLLEMAKAIKKRNVAISNDGKHL